MRRLHGGCLQSCTLALWESGLKLSLFLLYIQWLLRYWPTFKIYIFGHETLTLAKVVEVARTVSSKESKMSLIFALPAFQNCHIWVWNLDIGKSSNIHSLFLPQRSKIELIFTLQARGFQDIGPFSKLSYLALKLCPWQSSRSCKYILFLAQRLKLSLFSLYIQRYLRYGLIFKIAIFGHETWPIANVRGVAHILSFYPKGSKLMHILPQVF